MPTALATSGSPTRKPTELSVQAKSYPYARPTFYYTNGEPSGVAKEFLVFTIGPAGQKIVQQVGFVRVR